jgi:hypothetical protein
VDVRDEENDCYLYCVKSYQKELFFWVPNFTPEKDTKKNKEQQQLRQLHYQAFVLVCARAQLMELRRREKDATRTPYLIEKDSQGTNRGIKIADKVMKTAMKEMMFSKSVRIANASLGGDDGSRKSPRRGAFEMARSPPRSPPNSSPL